MGVRNGFGARGAYSALGVGLAVAVSYGLLPQVGSTVAVYLLTAAFGTALSCIGAARMPPARRRIWWAFALGQASFFCADVCWMAYDVYLGGVPEPSLADIGYLACYPLLALGMLWLIRGRRHGRDRAAFLDAAIVTSALTVIGVVFFVAPVAGSDAGLWGRVVAASYPAFDLLVLALAVRMLTGGMTRNASLWAILGGIALLLVADVFYLQDVVTGVAYDAWVDSAFLASYVLLGFAAVHPSAYTLSEPSPDLARRTSVGRVAWLGVALIVAPVTGQVAHLSGHGAGGWIPLLGGFVVAALVVARLMDLLRDLEVKAVQLAALARRDGLTGVANRRTWDHELSRALAFARDEDARLSVAIFDFDHFKAYNDAHGHLAGDRVLKATSAAWTAALPDTGFLARFGGEEFAVLLPRTDLVEAGRVLERLRTHVTHGQSCSIGVAAWDGAETPAQLVARADQALYEAKTRGRNRVAVHDGVTATAASATQHEDPALATIRTVFQPIVDVRSGEVVAHEALSRFDGATPEEVFERAAREGTSASVEALAIRTALADWDRERHLTLNVSLTALPSHEVRDALPQDLFGIILEITEEDLVDYTHDLMLVLEDLRTRRALIAIDDFGVGFSNVHRILTIRPDLIKLDMTLIRGIDQDEMRQAVIVACLLFARQTGSRVVAEGIETKAEMECLVRHGVELGQGYLIGRPAAATHF